MSKETVPFRQQLDVICKHLEDCKIERVRRHSEFTKRFDDICARHARLTSGRLRRLSLEGIIVDIDSIRGQRRDHYFSSAGTFETLPYLKRSKTESDVDTVRIDGALKLINDNLPEIRESHCYNEVAQKTGGHDGDQFLYKHLRLEVSFDSKNPRTSNPILTTLTNRNGWKNRRNKSFLDSHSVRHDQNKFKKAYAKVIHVQRFTSQRRHTILSMAPIELGEKPLNERHSSQSNINNNGARNGSPGFFLGSHVSPGTSGKQKFRRAVKKLENAKRFSNLIQSAKCHHSK